MRWIRLWISFLNHESQSETMTNFLSQFFRMKPIDKSRRTNKSLCIYLAHFIGSYKWVVLSIYSRRVIYFLSKLIIIFMNLNDCIIVLYDCFKLQILRMTVFWTGCGRCTWLGKISIVLISVWLLTIIISVNHVFKQHSSYPFTDDQYDKVDSEKLQKITNKILQLKKQNNVLRNLIYGWVIYFTIFVSFFTIILYHILFEGLKGKVA